MSRIIQSVSLLLFSLVVGSLALAQPSRISAADDAPWPQWRGPGRDGISSGPGWPATLKDDAFKEIWHADLGKSYSGPIVAKDRVFVTETVDDKQEVVRALDRKTGKELWKTGWDSTFTVIPMGRVRGSWIRATPAYDGKNLYVAGMRDVVVCLNGETGDVVWRADMAERYKRPVPPFGFSSSPLLAGDFLYVQAANSVLKLDKKTGKEVWRVLVEQNLKAGEGGAVTSPIMAKIDGRPMLLASDCNLYGIDPESGATLWKGMEDKSTSPLIMTPTMAGEKIFLSSGVLRAGLYEIHKTAEGYQPARLWENKLVIYMSSPIVIGNYVYLHLKNHRVACIDLATGKETWITGEGYGQYWSMIAQGDKILALSEDGTLYLVKANPEKFELLDSRDVSASESWSHLAVADDEVYVRKLQGLAVYRWKNP